MDGENLRDIVVYYGPEDGIRVSIDDGIPIDTTTATEELIKGFVHLTINHNKKEPTGLFSLKETTLVMEDGTIITLGSIANQGSGIDLDYIDENFFEGIIRLHFDMLKQYLKDSDLNIKCIKELPVPKMV